MASIRFESVYVDIPIYEVGNRSLKINVIAAATGGQIRPDVRHRTTVRAIDNLSLDLGHGTRVGLIGHNGAGKTTILRVMAGIYEPTGGRIQMEGTVASMFDLGFGMDPDASGWDNIMLRGMLLGASKREMRQLAPMIGEVSGLGEFLDMPMRAYSAGMGARLAFAVSTSIASDILLIDEGIGAGDAAFVHQAQARMESFIGSAGVLVMASHSDDLLSRWCDQGIWLEHGSLRMMGGIQEVLQAYRQSIV